MPICNNDEARKASEEACQKIDKLIVEIKALYQKAKDNSSDYFVPTSLDELKASKLTDDVVNERIRKLQKERDRLLKEIRQWDVCFEIDKFVRNTEKDAANTLCKNNKNELSKDYYKTVNEKVHGEAVPGINGLDLVITCAAYTLKTKRELVLFASRFNEGLENAARTAQEESEPERAAVGKKFNRSLNRARENFRQTGNADKFAHDVKKSIKESEPVLKSSTAWVSIIQLIQIALSTLIHICTLGISYIAAGRFNLFAAPAAKEHEIEDEPSKTIGFKKDK
jgi:hypothetical protein